MHLLTFRCCVRVVQSVLAGAGKSLWVKKKAEELCRKYPLEKGESRMISLPLYGVSAHVTTVIESLLPNMLSSKNHIPSLYHLNIPHEVQFTLLHYQGGYNIVCARCAAALQ